MIDIYKNTRIKALSKLKLSRPTIPWWNERLVPFLKIMLSRVDERHKMALVRI